MYMSLVERNRNHDVHFASCWNEKKNISKQIEENSEQCQVYVMQCVYSRYPADQDNFYCQVHKIMYVCERDKGWSKSWDKNFIRNKT